MIQTTPIILKNGLNLAASVLELSPGECVQLHNYEINTLGRYQRVLGFERFDGKFKPSNVKPKDLPGFPYPDDATELTAVRAERNARRNAIQTVPGAGPMRGVVSYNGVVYAFRDNAQASACNMYQSSEAGWQLVATPALHPGGKYEFTIANFKGSASSINLYGVDGVNQAFEFDGVTFTQIAGAITPDAPKHIEALPSQVLLLAYRGGTFLFSGVGEPHQFSPVDGGEK